MLVAVGLLLEDLEMDKVKETHPWVAIERLNLLQLFKACHKAREELDVLLQTHKAVELFRHTTLSQTLGLDEILLRASRKRPRLVGIYFLIKEDVIVYIGQSINLAARLLEHERTKDFDSYTFIPCDSAQLPDMEALYILKFKPSLNYMPNGSLGLPPIPNKRGRPPAIRTHVENWIRRLTTP